MAFCRGGRHNAATRGNGARRALYILRAWKQASTKEDDMEYTKPEVIAQNGANGRYAAGCPAEDRYREDMCLDCERTQ